ncbi:hypothetical protein AVEN_67037-1 [Araneus ventricosus]|uniref:Uncharacterized protein n=1 Tax=Araneus ventricosus TaxID=182803 RepID=A0A4Y2E5I8_ARAVE|nr:hypothetical protein AVEN_67037-1 [Araneus ventricosus]
MIKSVAAESGVLKLASDVLSLTKTLESLIRSRRAKLSFLPFGKGLVIDLILGAVTVSVECSRFSSFLLIKVRRTGMKMNSPELNESHPPP